MNYAGFERRLQRNTLGMYHRKQKVLTFHIPFLVFDSPITWSPLILTSVERKLYPAFNPKRLF